jgi:tryptophan synthase alpha subunit
MCQEHENMIAPFLTNTDIALVPLVTLTSIPERQAELVNGAEGFILCCDGQWSHRVQIAIIGQI